MAKFTSVRPINSRWRKHDFLGNENSSFSIPDEMYDEFTSDWSYEINRGYIVITETPTTGNIQVSTLTVGDVVLTGTATGNFGVSGGITTVLGTSPITVSGTSAITVGVISASTTSAGVVILSDSTSTTSSILAATPTAVKSAYDRGSTGVTDAATAQATADAAVAGTPDGTSQFGSSGVIGNLPLFVLTTNSNPASGSINHSKLTPYKNFTVSNISFISGTTANTAATSVRFGIYTRSGTTFTLVARTANDTSIFSAISTKYTRALDTTGGYPATYTLTAGTEYWISVIVVATTVSNIVGATLRLNTSANAATGGQNYAQAAQSDLVASSSAGIAGTGGGFYAEVS